MTESEARGKIKYRITTAMSIAGAGEDGKAYEDLEIALQVMKEIREYRELGTVEELKFLVENVGSIKLLKEYSAIGTVEELQALKDYKELYDVYKSIGTIEEFRKLKYKKNVLPIATIEFSKEDMQEIVDEKIKVFELDIKEIRNKAIDEFAGNMKDKSSDILFWLMKRQEEGYGTSNGELHDKWLCKIDEIAEQMKGGATDEG